jgi:hypothetical protein
MKIMYAIAVVADLALAVLLVALSGFIFGGGPEGMHGEAGAATVLGQFHRHVGRAHSRHFATASRATGSRRAHRLGAGHHCPPVRVNLAARSPRYPMVNVRDIESGKVRATGELFGADWYASNLRSALQR